MVAGPDTYDMQRWLWNMKVHVLDRGQRDHRVAMILRVKPVWLEEDCHLLKGTSLIRSSAGPSLDWQVAAFLLNGATTLATFKSSHRSLKATRQRGRDIARFLNFEVLKCVIRLLFLRNPGQHVFKLHDSQMMKVSGSHPGTIVS